MVAGIVCPIPKPGKDSSTVAGIVCPIPKPGKNSSTVAGYRPITMLSCIGKLLERILLKRIEYHTESKGLLMKSQMGFRRRRSTNDILHI
jgi:hypothetical protein